MFHVSRGVSVRHASCISIRQTSDWRALGALHGSRVESETRVESGMTSEECCRPMLQASAVCSLQFAVCSLQLAAGVDKVRCNVAGRRSQVAGRRWQDGARREQIQRSRRETAAHCCTRTCADTRHTPHTRRTSPGGAWPDLTLPQG